MIFLLNKDFLLTELTLLAIVPCNLLIVVKAHVLFHSTRLGVKFSIIWDSLVVWYIYCLFHVASLINHCTVYIFTLLLAVQASAQNKCTNWIYSWGLNQYVHGPRISYNHFHCTRKSVEHEICAVP